MFKGYLEFGDGGELVNVNRTETYIENSPARLPFHPQHEGQNLALANNEEPYRSPLLDRAPWANPLDPITNDFYGLYPLDVQGIGDSTYTAATTESVEDGGSTQRGRNSTRDVKVSGLLIGKSVLAAEAGLTWLRSMLQDVACADQCGGGYLRYYLADPDICPIAWGPELEGYSDSATFGTVTGPSRLLDVRWTKSVVDPTMPSRTLWTGIASEGSEIRYGARALDGTVLGEDRVYPLRRNYALNPTFFSDAARWTAVGATWALGGVDGDGYMTLQGGVVGSSADYGEGVYGIGTYGSVVQGLLTTTDAMPTPAGPVTASVAARGNGSKLTLQLLDGSTGAVVAAEDVYPGLEWARYSVSGITATTRLRLVAVDRADVDQVLVEAVPEERDYFDGGTPAEGYTTSWADAPNGSVSTRSYDAAWETVWDTSDYLPFLQVLSGTVQNLRLTWFYRDPFDVERQLLPYERTLHNVAVTQGPQILQRIDNTRTTGGYFIQVEILFTAGNPFSYAPPRAVPMDWIQTDTITDPTPNITPTDDWLYDPTALVPAAPPSAPDIVADAIDASITSWQRYYIPIPAEEVADWASSVPLLDIDSNGQAVRQVRVRFHPNPFHYDPKDIDPLSYCADFLISYLPTYTSLSLNGMVQTATATKAGVASVPADSILYGSDGGPMTWPRLSCGIPYVMTVDVPSPADYDLFSLSLSLAREE